jgi:hypothetical protein
MIQVSRKVHALTALIAALAPLHAWYERNLTLQAIQLSVTVRNARLDAIETAMGTSVIVRFFTGTQPANCATVDSGTLLAEGNMPSDWLAAASGGSKAKSGTWTITGVAAGTIGYFRVYESGSPSVCHIQGTVTATGGGGDMTVDNTSIAVAQVATVNTFTLSDANS